MSFSSEEIENVREIAALPSYAAAETLTTALNTAQEAATRSDIADFNKVKNSFAELKGELNTDNTAKRLAIRNRVRTRLGLSWLESEADLARLSGAGFGTYEFFHPAMDEI